MTYEEALEAWAEKWNVHLGFAANEDPVACMQDLIAMFYKADGINPKREDGKSTPNVIGKRQENESKNP